MQCGSIWDNAVEKSLCGLVDMVEKEQGKGGLSLALSPLLSLPLSSSLSAPSPLSL